MVESDTPPPREPHASCGPFGAFLRELRLQQGLSQRDLAEGICFRTYVSEIERGDRFPTPALLAGFAARLAVPLERLTGPYLASPMAGMAQRLALARTLAEHGRSEAAQSVLATSARLLAREPKPRAYEADMIETEALISYQADRLAHALAQFRAALQLRRKARTRRYPLARACFRYGLAALHAGQEETAQQALFDAYHEILWLDPSAAPESRERVADMHVRVVQALGYLLLKRQELQGALYVYRMALLRWDACGIAVRNYPDIALGHALAKMGTGNLHEARRILTGLLAAPQPGSVLVRAHNNLGLLHRLRAAAGGVEAPRGNGRRRTPAHLQRARPLRPAGGGLGNGRRLAPASAGPGARRRQQRTRGRRRTFWAPSWPARGDGAAAQRYLTEAGAVPGVPLALQQRLHLERLRLAIVTGDCQSSSAALEALETTLSVAKEVLA